MRGSHCRRRGKHRSGRHAPLELIESSPRAALIGVGCGEQQASGHELELEPRCGGSAQIAERLTHDIGGPSEFSRTEGSRLHHLARDLVFGGIDELDFDRVRHMLQHDEIAQALEEIGREPARLMAGLHDPIDHHKQCCAIVGRHRIDGFVEERAIGHAELRDGLCVGDAVGAAAGDDLAEDREAVADAAGPGTSHEGERCGISRHSLRRADRRQVLGEHLRRHEPEGVVVGA